MRDVLFMGTVLASATHEMQNVIAIIKESGALAEDIIAINGLPRMKHGEKIPQALATIREQVDRGRALMRMLNDFAHAASDFPLVCDLARYTAQVAVLAARTVALRECSLSAAPCSGPLPVRANAMLLMQSLYLAVLDVLAVAGRGDAIVLAVLSGSDGTVSSGDDFGKEAGLVRVDLRKTDVLPVCGEALSGLVKDMGGICLASPGAITLGFPLPDAREGMRA